MTLFGIDVSHHQGAIDWSQVAGSGVAFAIAKATEGVGHVDTRFVANVGQARGAGLVPGAYHFLTGVRPGDEQAAAFLKAVAAAGIGPRGAPALWAVDVEYAAVRPTRGHVLDFVDEIGRAAPGHPLIVYTGETFWRQLTGNLNGRAEGLRLWDAGTGSRPDAYVPGSGTIAELWAKVSTRGWDGYGGWGPSDRAFLQFTASARVPGVRTPCDADAFFGDLDALRALTRPPRPPQQQEADVPTPREIFTTDQVIDLKPGDPDYTQANPSWTAGSALRVAIARLAQLRTGQAAHGTAVASLASRIDALHRDVTALRGAVDQLQLAGVDPAAVAAAVAGVLAGQLPNAAAIAAAVNDELARRTQA